VFTLELDSPTLPPGKKIIFQLSDTAKLADTKHHPIAIKEGVEYKYVSCDPVETVFVFMATIQCPHHVQSQSFHHFGTTHCYNHFGDHSDGLSQGVRYVQLVKRAGVKGLLDAF
jgi:hypothetical protein